jgi:hypothetical protein
LFVAVGSAELSSKIASYTIDQRVFVTKNFWWFLCCGGRGGGDSIVARFLFVLHHRSALSIGLLEDGLAIRYTIAREYGALLEGSPGSRHSTYPSKVSDLRPQRIQCFHCQPTAPRESYSMMCVIHRRNIRSLVHRWCSHF